jgi:hypothetical protein
MIRAVFVFDGEDLSVHPSIEAAAAGVEAIDVDNGAYDFFADDGTVLVPSTHGQEVTLRETGERRPEELRARLHRYLSHPGVAIDPGLTDDPVAAAQAIINAEWERRSFKWFPWLDRRANGAAPPVL